MDEPTDELETDPDDPLGSPRLQRRRSATSDLRQQAAAMWVDVEEEGRPPSKTAIARALGFTVANRGPVACTREPEFSRAVEYERIRRIAQGSGRMTKEEIAVLSSMIARAGMLEAARRLVIDPQSVGNRELLPESRAFARLAAEVDDSPGNGSGGVHQTINVFFEAAGRLPPKAREKFLGIFDGEMRRLALAAGEAREKAERR